MLQFFQKIHSPDSVTKKECMYMYNHDFISTKQPAILGPFTPRVGNNDSRTINIIKKR